MQGILEQFNQAGMQDDLFTFWEEELSLRHLLRHEAYDQSPVQISSLEEIDFLFRSLYFSGQSNDFLQLLFKHLQAMPVLNWLSRSPDWLKSDFFTFLPWHIDNVKASPQELQYLIRIYQEDYHQAFRKIVNVFDLDTCAYLLPRTANPGFRRLIQERHKQLLTTRATHLYGLIDDQNKGLPYPTILGDKNLLLHRALESLQKSSADKFRDPYSARRFELLMQSGELMFRAGLIEDCLAFLLDSYEDYREKSRLVDLMEDMKIHKQFNKMLRAVLPLYALLFNPLQASAVARQIYTRDFGQMSWDEPSLYYLELFASIASGLQLRKPGIIYEIQIKSRGITRLRPGEPELLRAEEMEQGLGEERLHLLEQLYRQKLLSRPHEALVIMEMIRLMASLNLAPLDHGHASQLLRAYLNLWKWAPSPLFFNEQITEQLAPLADKQIRQEAERALSLLDDFRGNKLSHELAIRPELFRKKGEEIRRAILVGQFTGVM